MTGILELLGGEIDDTLALIHERREEVVARANEQVAELQQLKAALGQSIGTEEARAKLRALRKRALGSEEVKRQSQLKTQDMRVRMRAPADLVAAPTQAKKETQAQFQRGPSRIVVSGTLQRELSAIDARIVELMMEGPSPARSAEVALLSDIRSGVNGLLSEMPEHDVLLGLVAEFGDQVDGVLKDLAVGGASRMKRLYDHARELLGRLRSLAKIDLKDKALKADVERLGKQLDTVKKDMGKPTEAAVSAAEKMLLDVHKTLGERGVLGARSMLFSALRASEQRQS